MPLIQVFTSASPDTSVREKLLQELSHTLASAFHKPEQYVMTCLVPGAAMTFGGTNAPTCFAVVRNIGKMSPALTEKLSAELCRSLSSRLSVPSERIYIDFGDAEGFLWGWNGSTFG